MQLEVVDNISEQEFVDEFVAKNKPVVVDNIPYEPEKWRPEALKESIGELTTQIYGTLFDLENIVALEEYLDDYFGQSESGAYPEDVPYVRWYNQLKNVDFVWGDEAFDELSGFWTKPRCMPSSDLLVPVTSKKPHDPVTDNFPYRGILVAARGARTRLHRDPFCSDAIVAQFHGTKDALLYSPERTQELTESKDGTSFGGFVDVRGEDLTTVLHEPDYSGLVKPGQMIYIPHGWTHDVLVTEDSVSITWNFVHKRGAKEFLDYLRNDPTGDSEFEVLQYFFERAGMSNMSPEDMLREVA